MLSAIEICAGGGGQALGLEQACFQQEVAVELDAACCATLRLNRPLWRIVEGDVTTFNGKPYAGVDLLAGGLPCPPFSKAGKQLGSQDERNLFPAALRLVDEIRPRALMIENVRGILDPIFADYRQQIISELRKLGYEMGWRVFHACDFGVPQLRPRVVFVALQHHIYDHFTWPKGQGMAPTVGAALYDLMAARGWLAAERWREQACNIAPTIVGGSKKHGGPDLGPTRARKAWAALGVDGLGIADEAPNADFVGMPRLTVRMVARLQGFPDNWQFTGRKTSAYRQVGNAFPPPVARAVAIQIREALHARRIYAIKRVG
ncbi:DNA cytosine methyltransferase [Candidatus Viridilinea mediisalina]|uniref:Cytosine-specific methyltransferase n=1 Tax=Candidatus Viridilinea mediisalina TaxID=2024553 RepID=A0A2A6RM90_9CHLR|nr:DNA (cytosine-5-)-methyltransferase [Candidatus Viridilinea mediisalina]PDW03979.1 DNA (cytosine-5-)-methyltransferase [Candidatus Viridilinea mediisalina]